MISTAIMIQLGRVVNNSMVDMQLSNNKLVDRGTLMVQSELNITYNAANSLLLKYGSVRAAVESQKTKYD
jgi:N-acetylmuramic acid 6-phosphate etherase